MQIKSLFLLACLLASTLLGANNAPIPNALPNASTSEGPSCDLPAPFGFHIEAIGATWVTMGWGGNVLYQHRIRMYRVSDNFLLSTTIVPAGTLTATIAIPFDTQVKAVINAICIDGGHSPNTTEKILKGIILDLVVNGFHGSTESSSCNFSNIGTCDFEGSGYTTFKISLNGQYPKQFDVEPGHDQYNNLKYFIRLPTSNGGSNTFNFYCDSDVQPDCQTPLITVKFNGSIVAYIDAFQTTGTNTLWGNLNVNGTSCRIDRLTFYNGSGFVPDPPKGLLRPGSTLSDHMASASPNPFSEALEVFLPPSTAEQVQLQLFNLNGQKVLDQEFEGGQEQYSLSTAGLSPGFYLLRIEADGEVQTLKVVKSE